MRLLRCDSCGMIEEVGRGGGFAQDYTFLTVEANEDADHANLCGWDCLAAWSMSKAMEKREARHA